MMSVRTFTRWPQTTVEPVYDPAAFQIVRTSGGDRLATGRDDTVTGQPGHEIGFMNAVIINESDHADDLVCQPGDMIHLGNSAD